MILLLLYYYYDFLAKFLGKQHVRQQTKQIWPESQNFIVNSMSAVRLNLKKVPVLLKLTCVTPHENPILFTVPSLE